MKTPVDRMMLGQARAEVAELRAEVERLKRHIQAIDDGQPAPVREQLAAANALLEEMQHAGTTSLSWRQRVRAHLAAQPATAPRCDTHDVLLANEAFFRCGCRHYAQSAEAAELARREGK